MGELSMMPPRGGPKFATGSVTSTAAEYGLLNVAVGFTPDLVIIYDVPNNTTDIPGGNLSNPNSKHIPKILTQGYIDSSGGAIETNGFSVYASKNRTLYYIAIKF